MMNSNGAKGEDWVEKYVESRVSRGRDWRKEIDKHKELARDSIYIRILGGGFRPVSISECNPCGHLVDKKNNKEIKACKSLESAKKKASCANHGNLDGNKPEHQIQAFLIRHALMNDYAFGRIDKLFPGFECEFDELHFITDEFSATPGGEIRACRADIVALGGKDGKYFPIFIEIKVKRELKRLMDQLTNAYDKLWKNERARGHFSDFLSAVSCVKEIDQSQNAAKKMVIWADGNKGRESKAVEEARRLGLLIAQCSHVGGSYEFVRDVAPQQARHDS